MVQRHEFLRHRRETVAITVSLAKAVFLWQSVVADMSKQSLVLLLLICLALTPGCRKPIAEKAESRAEPLAKEGPRSLLRYHFAGGRTVAKSGDATMLKQVWGLPSTRILHEDALRRLGLAAHKIVVGGDAKDPSGGTFEPLLQDLLTAESIADVRGEGGKASEWALAVLLEPDRTEVWNKHLHQALVEGGGGISNRVQFEGATGWEVKSPGKERLVRIFSQGGWLVLGTGRGSLSAHADMVKALTSKGRPAPGLDNDWLTGEIDFARWNNGLSLPLWVQGPPGQWPRATFGFGARENYLRTRVKLAYDRPVSWPTPEWKVPTSLARDPLVSFTAGRGIAEWLGKIDFVKKLQLATPPSQLFAWAQGDVPQGFQTFAAAPAANASNLVQTIGRGLPAALDTNLAQRIGGDILWASNRTEIRWQGLPFVVPYLRTAEGPEGNFLLGGLFAQPTGTNAPAELFDQLKGRTNLVYYDWEITQARLAHWLSLVQLYTLVIEQRSGTNLHRRSGTVELHGQEWLKAIAPLLGETITEITQTGPAELTLVRKSHSGFSGFELVQFAQWLKLPAGGSKEHAAGFHTPHTSLPSISPRVP